MTGLITIARTAYAEKLRRMLNKTGNYFVEFRIFSNNRELTDIVETRNAAGFTTVSGYQICDFFL